MNKPWPWNGFPGIFPPRPAVCRYCDTTTLAARFLLVRSRISRFKPANTPPDCLLAQRFRNNTAYPVQLIRPCYPAILTLMSGQVTNPLTPHRRPPKLPNRLCVVRQVSQNGKPLCTGRSFRTFLNLPGGSAPLDPPARDSPLHPEQDRLRKPEANHPPDDLPQVPAVRPMALLLPPGRRAFRPAPSSQPTHQRHWQGMQFISSRKEQQHHASQKEYR